MKGLVFNELLDFMERHEGLACVDAVLTRAQTEGVYVAVGAYDHREFHRLVDAWCELTGKTRRPLLASFGEHMFATLVARFPAFSEKCSSAFDLFIRLDAEIHAEVLKLYPDADLPVIQVEQSGTDSLRISYESHRELADFAQGMIQGCINHFGEKIAVSRIGADSMPPSVALFQLNRAA